MTKSWDSRTANYLQLFCSRSLHDTGIMFKPRQCRHLWFREQIFKCRLGKGLQGKDEKSGRSSRWLSRCWGMGVKRRCHPAVSNTSKRRQNEMVRLTRRCWVSARAQAAPRSSCLWGEGLAINPAATLGWVGGKSNFDCFMPGSPAFTRWGVENKTEHK